MHSRPAADKRTRGASRRNVLLALASMASSTMFAHPQKAQLAARDATDEYFRDCMTRERIPGLAVAVLRGRSLVWSKGYGYANLAQNVPMTPDTIQNIGSVSKTFTAVSYTHLTLPTKRIV